MRLTRTVLAITSLCLTLTFVLIIRRSQYSENSQFPHSDFSGLEDTVTPSDKNVAFASFLGANLNPDESRLGNGALHAGKTAKDLEEEDGYFLGIRVLAYSLLHDPRTKIDSSIPFIVLVTPDVNEAKRERLRLDGANVVVAKRINADWLRPVTSRYRDVLSKLQLFKMTKFRKICFIDADMLVTGRLDNVFQDPATEEQQTLDDQTAIRADEAPMPSTYMFAGKGDSFKYDHPIPPKPSEYLNGGFFVFTPAKQMFKYYESIIKIPHRFDSSFPEQNLFNYAHRRAGNMPWTTLDWKWNANWPTVKDAENGIKSFHAKYWDTDPTHDQVLKRRWAKLRDDMRSFHGEATRDRSAP